MTRAGSAFLSGPLQVLKLAVAAFSSRCCQFCLIGGHAASLYRAQERLTSDVDFALVAESLEGSQALAEEVIAEIGLEPILGFIARGEREDVRRSICMVSSRPTSGRSHGIIDIVLPDLPWVSSAVARAQHNKIDLGFAAVPVITPEDLVVAKSYSVRNSPDRFQDLDDLKEIFRSVKQLDLDYLVANLARLSVEIPEEVRKFAPASLRAAYRRRP